MLNKVKNRKQEGFTIVEVLIVLAIAGLIIAIVLFAVPSLQRQGRNTAITTDANSLAGYVGDFKQANEGAAPKKSGTGVAAGVVTISGGSVDTKGKIQAGTTVAVDAGAGTLSPAAGTISMNVGAACGDAAKTTGFPVVANARAVAIVYSTEAGSSTVYRCISA